VLDPASLVPPGATGLTWADGTPANLASTWGNLANEIGFRIERAPVDALDNIGTYAEVGKALANHTMYKDTGIALGGKYSYRVIAFNEAGETTSAAVAIGPVTDTTHPVTVSNIGSMWHQNPFSVSLTPTDTLSGVAATNYTADGSAEASYTAPFAVSGEGSHPVTFWSVDASGNVEPTVSETVKIDNTAPATTDNHVPTYVGSALITLSPTDALSGVEDTFWKLDGGKTMAGTKAKTTKLGAHALEYWSVDAAGNAETPHTVSFFVETVTSNVKRLSGATRYDVSLGIARDAYPGWACVEHVVVASGEDRAAPDALTAAGLAGVYDAPLLLNPYGSVRSDVAAAIAAMPDGVQVHIVGGPASVSASVATQLGKIAGVASVDRVNGADRYEVAVNVAKKMKTVLGMSMPHSALMVNGNRSTAMFDALAASAVSAKMHYPVLLVRDSSVPAVTQSALASVGLTKRYIVGGTASVSEGVRAALGVAPGDRIAGADRYMTAVAVAIRAQAEGWLSPAYVGIAARMPDATTGGAYMGKKDGVMLYARRDGVPASTAAYLKAKQAVIVDVFVFGGASSIAETTRASIHTLIK
ncbi:MAG: cell wall-binding repeat-containing protein, partial [Coriobacteriia bacterium]|nr:cell wall-binding repeat-containing protein [Coriobacteriia bacterium]